MWLGMVFLTCPSLSVDPQTEHSILVQPATVTDVQRSLENRRNTGGAKTGTENNWQTEQVKLQFVRADLGGTGYCSPHDCFYRKCRVPVSSHLFGGIVPRIISWAFLVLIYLSTLMF